MASHYAGYDAVLDEYHSSSDLATLDPLRAADRAGAGDGHSAPGAFDGLDLANGGVYGDYTGADGVEDSGRLNAAAVVGDVWGTRRTGPFADLAGSPGRATASGTLDDERLDSELYGPEDGRSGSMEALKSANEALKRKEVQLAQLEQALDRAHQGLERAEVRARGDARRHAAELAELKERHVLSLRQQRDRRDAAVRSADRREAKAMRRRDEASATAGEATARMELQAAQLRSASLELTELQDRNAILSKQLESVSDKAEERRVALAGALSKVELADEKAAKFRNRVDVLDDENKALRAGLEQSRTELRRIRDESERRISALTGTLNARSRALGEAEANLRATGDKLSELEETLEKKNDALQAALERARVAESTADTEVTTLQKRAQEAEMQNARLKVDLDEAQTQLDESGQNILRLEREVAAQKEAMKMHESLAAERLLALERAHNEATMAMSSTSKDRDSVAAARLAQATAEALASRLEGTNEALLQQVRDAERVQDELRAKAVQLGAVRDAAILKFVPVRSAAREQALVAAVFHNWMLEAQRSRAAGHRGALNSMRGAMRQFMVRVVVSRSADRMRAAFVQWRLLTSDGPPTTDSDQLHRMEQQRGALTDRLRASEDRHIVRRFLFLWRSVVQASRMRNKQQAVDPASPVAERQLREEVHTLRAQVTELNSALQASRDMQDVVHAPQSRRSSSVAHPAAHTVAYRDPTAKSTTAGAPPPDNILVKRLRKEVRRLGDKLVETKGVATQLADQLNQERAQFLQDIEDVNVAHQNEIRDLRREMAAAQRAANHARTRLVDEHIRSLESENKLRTFEVETMAAQDPSGVAVRRVQAGDHAAEPDGVEDDEYADARRVMQAARAAAEAAAGAISAAEEEARAEANLGTIRGLQTVSKEAATAAEDPGAYRWEYDPVSKYALLKLHLDRALSSEHNAAQACILLRRLVSDAHFCLAEDLYHGGDTLAAVMQLTSGSRKHQHTYQYSAASKDLDVDVLQALDKSAARETGLGVVSEAAMSLASDMPVLLKTQRAFDGILQWASKGPVAFILQLRREAMQHLQEQAEIAKREGDGWSDRDKEESKEWLDDGDSTIGEPAIREVLAACSRIWDSFRNVVAGEHRQATTFDGTTSVVSAAAAADPRLPESPTRSPGRSQESNADSHGQPKRFWSAVAGPGGSSEESAEQLRSGLWRLASLLQESQDDDSASSGSTSLHSPFGHLREAQPVKMTRSSKHRRMLDLRLHENLLRFVIASLDSDSREAGRAPWASGAPAQAAAPTTKSPPPASQRRSKSKDARRRGDNVDKLVDKGGQRAEDLGRQLDEVHAQLAALQASTAAAAYASRSHSRSRSRSPRPSQRARHREETSGIVVVRSPYLAPAYSSKPAPTVASSKPSRRKTRTRTRSRQEFSVR